ncbi:tripartite tricarboxylate transporter substrate binding protein [Allopusillimonas soli]|uniref:Tripartite tricarboxylate transporter substrate binding protein n=1 Tax=Allopusillimonas soli TaxID=659016 RepID=A0A853F898_9BURK|nr:tripartite tricarboxylate transporter substrate binding protein [Allopusillimonas soli]TEA76379.1 tripartite tricarboxylate transporter substrate binding protein [Allopusillimonas soli]
MKKHVLMAGILCCAGALLTGGPARAVQDLPDKPITLIVGFVAGGAADTSARVVAEKLAENTGRSIAVVNKPGAGGNIAHQYVANGPDDGSMLLLGSVGPLTVAPHLMDVPYDPFKDLAPISGGVNFPNVLVVHKAAGVKTFKEFIALAKSDPDKVDFASTGYGSASHMAGELLNIEAGINMVHVPYKGGAQAMQDLLGERVMSYFSAPPTAMPYVEQGRLIPLATTGLKRPDFLPDLPTIAESGYPGFEALNWYAFVAPGKTPPAILDRWNEEIVKVLNDPKVKKTLSEHGLIPHPTTREEFAAFMHKESDKWARIIKERHLKK